MMFNIKYSTVARIKSYIKIKKSFRNQKPLEVLKLKEFKKITKTFSKKKNVLINCVHANIYNIKLEKIISENLHKNYNCKVTLLCNIDNYLFLRSCYANNDIKVILVNDYFPFKYKGYAYKLYNDLDWSSYDSLKKFKIDNYPILLHVLATIAALSSNGLPTIDKLDRQLVKKLFLHSVRHLLASANIIRRFKPDIVVATEKGNIFTCELFYISLKCEIDFLQYHNCHEPNTIISKRLNKENFRSHTFSVSKKSFNEYDNLEKIDNIIDYFHNGYVEQNWFKYKKLITSTEIYKKQEFYQLLDIDKNKKTAIIFCHILNDANFFHGTDLFSGGFREWLIETVLAAKNNTDVNWLLKLHPANTYRRKRLNEDGEFGEILAIKEELGEIPPNIKIVYPDNYINPLNFIKYGDFCITVRGTVGVEAACFGNTVVNAGTGRYSGFGFTQDPLTAESYISQIRSLPELRKLSGNQVKRAQRYATLFFKERPFNYSGIATDIENRNGLTDLAFVSSEKHDVSQLENFLYYVVNSDDDDFLSHKNYIARETKKTQITKRK